MSSEPIPPVADEGAVNAGSLPIPVLVAYPDAPTSEDSLSSNPIINLLNNKTLRKSIQSLIILLSLVSVVTLAVIDLRNTINRTATIPSPANYSI